MKRQVINTPFDAHSLTFSTYRRAKVFVDPRFCELFLEVLDRERAKLKFEVWAYVVMPDHVHLLIWPTEPDYDVSKILKALKQPVAARVLSLMRFEESPLLPRLWHAASGQHRLWQAGGGFDRNIYSRGLTVNTLKYIHENPVVAGFVESPWQYRWSSAGWYYGLADTPLRVDPNRD